MFKPNESELQRNTNKVKKYVKLLEKHLGNDFKVIGILEIGSFAKGEAVPTSDCDTRVFVYSPKYYAWQLSGGRATDRIMSQLENQYKRMTKKEGVLPRKEFEWFSFNNPIADKIKKIIKINVEFGIADYRFSSFCLNESDKLPTYEISLLFQSNIIYDPNGCLKTLRKKFSDKKPKATTRFYRQNCINKVPEELYSHLQSHKYDLLKLKKSHQIQWVKWAVRCLRDVVAVKEYIRTGRFIYKKSEVLKYYKKNLPSFYKDISEIYSWKCDPEKREEMSKMFIKNQNSLFEKFKIKTKIIEKIIKAIKSFP